MFTTFKADRVLARFKSSYASLYFLIAAVDAHSSCSFMSRATTFDCELYIKLTVVIFWTVILKLVVLSLT
jgi:hypothetical protein